MPERERERYRMYPFVIFMDAKLWNPLKSNRGFGGILPLNLQGINLLYGRNRAKNAGNGAHSPTE
jgi:hypothetical protein